MLGYNDIARLEKENNVYKMQTTELCATCGRELWVLGWNDYDYHYCRKCMVIKYLSLVPEDNDEP